MNDDKKQRLATAVKWGIGLLAAAIIAPAVFLAVQVRNLGDVRWLATEDGSAGKGTGRHIACFILEPKEPQ